MADWKTVLGVTHKAVRVLVISSEGEDLLKAHLPSNPDHPRALLTVLEGLALWHGKPMSAVISADVPVSHSLGLGSFGDFDNWPSDSALVQFKFAIPARGGRRLNGFGSFRSLRRLAWQS
jgi:hypothetical protein